MPRPHRGERMTSSVGCRFQRINSSQRKTRISGSTPGKREGATVTRRAFAPFLAALAVMLGLLAIGAGTFFLAPFAEAQTELAGVSGRVTDPSGAVIVDAEVEIKNVETNVSATVK